jgi:hypothetical protein
VARWTSAPAISYRRHGKLAAVVIVEAGDLLHARVKAGVLGLDQEADRASQERCHVGKMVVPPGGEAPKVISGSRGLGGGRRQSSGAKRLPPTIWGQVGRSSGGFTVSVTTSLAKVTASATHRRIPAGLLARFGSRLPSMVGTRRGESAMPLTPNARDFRVEPLPDKGPR